MDMLEVFVLAVGIFLIVYLLILRPHKIKGESMHPTFPDGEFLLTEQISYYRTDPKRGDVVVFKPPVSDDEYIKRIIGLPGDTISINNGSIFINEKKLSEEYIVVETNGGNFLREGDSYAIPQEKYFVVGDNRTHSSDSRTWGPITKDVITGKAWLTYWPIKQAGMVKSPIY